MTTFTDIFLIFHNIFWFLLPIGTPAHYGPFRRRGNEAGPASHHPSTINFRRRLSARGINFISRKIRGSPVPRHPLRGAAGTTRVGRPLKIHQSVTAPARGERGGRGGGGKNYFHFICVCRPLGQISLTVGIGALTAGGRPAGIRAIHRVETPTYSGTPAGYTANYREKFAKF